MYRSNRLLIALALAVALLVIWCRSRGGDERAPVPAPTAPAITTSTSPELAAPVRPRAAPSTSIEEPLQTIPALPGPSPYPPGSQPLTEGSDPATTVAEDDPVDTDSGIHVVFGPRLDVVHPPDPIVIDLQVLDRAGHRLPITNGRAYFRSDRDTAASGTGAHVAFVDDGSGADRKASDLAFTATFTPADRSLMRFRTFVEVAFDAPHGLGERRYSASVQYTPRPQAELDGEYSDALEGGSLVVRVGVAVTTAARYKVIGSLYGGDSAIAFAQNAIELDAGRGSIPLSFFGKILHDRGLDGPYVLRYVMLFEEFPDQGIYWPGVTADRAYTTRAYRTADFSPESYAEPASTEPPITAQSPSQQGKPPPMFTR
jgi:hypothetical protein